MKGNRKIASISRAIRRLMHFKQQYVKNIHILCLIKSERTDLYLLTAHRRENLGEPMRNMFRAINRLLAKHDDIQVIYPVHMNPAVREVADELLGGNERVHLIEPLEVVDFHNFAARSHIILTDSGGIQEEAPSLGKPVIVLARYDRTSGRDRSRYIETRWNG